MSNSIIISIISDGSGRWYTGNMRHGKPEFSTHKDIAIELDPEELEQEMKKMPDGCVAVETYRVVGRSEKAQ